MGPEPQGRQLGLQPAPGTLQWLGVVWERSTLI
jgi:hypothetical protein